MKQPGEAPLSEGWAWPVNAKKAHYFVNKESLCRRWMYLADLEASESIVEETSGDCLACRKLFKRRLAVNDR